MSTFFAPPAEAAINRSTTLLINLGAVFITLTTVSLILRIWVRTKIVACWGKDDWAMLVTQVSFNTLHDILQPLTDNFKRHAT